MVEKKVLENIKVYKILLIISVISIFNNLIAQTRLTIIQATIYDQNIFRNYLEIPDWVNQTSLYVEHDLNIKTSRLHFEYTGDLNLFRNYQERLFHTHNLGILSFLPLNNNLQFNIGTTHQWRKNKPDYNIYDYSNWSVYSQFQWEKWQSSPFKIGYQYRNRIFNNLNELSFREHSGFLKIKHFFPTKTTFIGEINLAIKKYTYQQTVEELIISIGDYTGKGKRHRCGNGNKEVSTDTSIIAYNMTAPNTKQWSLKFKLAQSISSTTGLSTEYVKRFKPNENTRYLKGQEYSYMKNDELYDDPYTYGGHEWQFILTQLLPWSSQLKIHVSFYDKNYFYPATGDLMEEVGLRRDKQKLFGINLNKRIRIDRMIQNIAVYFSYYYLKNKSNDYYFNFNGHLFDGGFEMIF